MTAVGGRRRRRAPRIGGREHSRWLAVRLARAIAIAVQSLIALGAFHSSEMSSCGPRSLVVFNPFTETAETHVTDAELVVQAKNGDRAALEMLVLRHQAWIYNIAVRMVFSPQDAEEVTQ